MDGGVVYLDGALQKTNFELGSISKRTHSSYKQMLYSQAVFLACI